MVKGWPAPRRGGQDSEPSQNGQVLIIVALSLTVLLLFVGLAVDVGFWYGQRRHMQNAADAGALAGAWELCLGDKTRMAATATEYAVRNGADSDQVVVTLRNASGTLSATECQDPANYKECNTVVVTAATDAPTFFARLVGIESVPVSAKAAAACGGAESGCGALPIAFDALTYNSRIPCSEWDAENGRFTRYVVGSTFLLWADDNETTRLEYICEKCVCDSIIPYIVPEYVDDSTVVVIEGHEATWHEWQVHWSETGSSQESVIIGGSEMSPGNRGWLRLGLDKPYTRPAGSEGDNDCSSLQSCGSALKCWIKYGYTGMVSVGDCLKAQPGVDASTLAKAQTNVGQVRNFILYDQGGCASGDPISANCSEGGGSTSKTYKVAGIGCGLVMHVFDKKNHNDITFPNSPAIPCGGQNQPPCVECPTKELGILVTRVCGECPNSSCVGTAGRPIAPGEPGAASLVVLPGGE